MGSGIMDLLQDIHSMLDCPQSELESLKGGKEGTTTGLRAAAPWQQLRSSYQMPTPSTDAGLEELAEDVRANVAKRAQQLLLLSPIHH